MQNTYLLLLLVLSYNAAKVEPVLDDTVCTACRCYRVKCSRLTSNSDYCVDTYKETCDSPVDIVEELDCNVKCDCCLEGQCYSSSNYYCFMMRTFEFFSMLYFLTISINLFLVNRLYKLFFEVKRQYDPLYFPAEIVKDKLNYHKFEWPLWITRPKGYIDTLSENSHHFKLNALFKEIESVKRIGIRNMVLTISILSFYSVLAIINLYVLFFMLESPFLYGRIAWAQHILHITFYALYIFAYFYAARYKTIFNTKLDNFEKEYRCKVRLVKKYKVFVVNWSGKMPPKIGSKVLMNSNVSSLKSDVVKINAFTEQEDSNLDKNI